MKFGPSISHLMYVDDVTFIGGWSEINFVNLNRLPRYFFIASVLKVNLHKRKVYGIGVDNLEVNRLPASSNMMGMNMKLAKNWNLVMEKFKKRLSNWKAKALSFGGRLTHVNSVLYRLPLYYFSIFRAPRKIILMLDGIRKRFLWGNDGEKRKINLVSWDLVTKPKREGGLGVDSLESANLALLAKWW
uniref:Reverse transcriptase domain-containing protein n=1 Tax=Lactuca sativa TaxID=4236 RepID=A0A9R1WI51_LACSA|nr:hypothetical protein LSAT_V11C200064170 [Lactuca sativa]